MNRRQLLMCALLFLFSATGFCQNVGIGTTAPKARLHVVDSSVVFTAGDPFLSVPNNTPVNGAGARMLWYPGKSAFRAGYVDGVQWDKDNIGYFSFSAGYSTNANNLYSTALGRNTSATGTSSTSMGYFTLASGNNSTALGSYSNAIGSEATAMGSNNTAFGFASTAMGFATFARGDYSASFGSNTKSRSPNSVVIGLYNDTTNTNRLFEIGNGTSDVARSNALTVLTNGNIGVGTPAPGYPLNFSNTLGDKISLYGSSGDHYGFGIQAGSLQMYTDAAAANINFGFGSSANFTERVRINNSGTEGMYVSGRLHIKNGSSPVDPAQTGGVWLYKADNTALLSFVGTENNKNVGFYGGPAGWGFTYDAINSRVGIGNTNPVNRLDVAGLNNWDLTNTEGDVRIGNSSYRIKFGVALAGAGAGASSIMQHGVLGGFNNLALGSQGKAYINLNGGGDYIDITNVNGGIRVNGNAGSPGQVLQSNGSSAAPSWTGKAYALSYSYPLQTYSYLTGAGVLSVPIPGLDNQLFGLEQASTVVFNANLNFSGDVYTASYGYLRIKILNSLNQEVASALAWGQALADNRVNTVTALLSVNLPAGIYHTQVLLVRNSESDGNFSFAAAKAVLQIFPN